MATYRGRSPAVSSDDSAWMIMVKRPESSASAASRLACFEISEPGRSHIGWLAVATFGEAHHSPAG